MPNWGYMSVDLAWNLALALWIGGIVVLGALVAPHLFRTLESRSAAGEAFGGILRKFARLRAVLIPILVLSGGIRFLLWEGNVTVENKGAWILLRWTAVAVMAAGLAYEILFLERAIARERDGGEVTPRFRTLHARAELLMKVSLVAAIGALFLG